MAYICGRDLCIPKKNKSQSSEMEGFVISIAEVISETCLQECLQRQLGQVVVNRFISGWVCTIVTLREGKEKEEARCLGEKVTWKYFLGTASCSILWSLPLLPVYHKMKRSFDSTLSTIMISPAQEHGTKQPWTHPFETVSPFEVVPSDIFIKTMQRIVK